MKICLHCRMQLRSCCFRTALARGRIFTRGWCRNCEAIYQEDRRMIGQRKKNTGQIFVGWHREGKEGPWKRRSRGETWGAAWHSLQSATSGRGDLMVLPEGERPEATPGQLERFGKERAW